MFSNVLLIKLFSPHQYAKYIESPVKASNFVSSGSVKSRLRRSARNRCRSAHQVQHHNHYQQQQQQQQQQTYQLTSQQQLQANYSKEASTSFGESLALDTSIDGDSCCVEYSQTGSTMDGVVAAGAQDGVAEGGTDVPMVRGVPNRRTFDSGYGGDSQSCISSPVAEPKLGKQQQQQQSFASECSNQTTESSSRPGRTQLKRQKAVDRSALSSAQSARSRASGAVTSASTNHHHHHQQHYRRTTSATASSTARLSSSDYEEYGDDDYDLYDCNNPKHASLSLGRLPPGDSLHLHFSQTAVKAYNRLRRKTSFNTSSSEEVAGDGDDDDEDEQNDDSSSGGCYSDGSNLEEEEGKEDGCCSRNEHIEAVGAVGSDLQKVSNRLARLQVLPSRSSTGAGLQQQPVVSGELSPQIASS